MILRTKGSWSLRDETKYIDCMGLVNVSLANQDNAEKSHVGLKTFIAGKLPLWLFNELKLHDIINSAGFELQNYI